MEDIELCRLCALEKDNLLFIYGAEGNRLCLEEKIRKCLNIELSEKAYLPKSVCLDCCTKLDAFEEFLDHSQNAQNTLCILFPERIEHQDELILSVSEEECKEHDEDVEDSDTIFVIKTDSEKSKDEKEDFVDEDKEVDNAAEELYSNEKSDDRPCEENICGLECNSNSSESRKTKDWLPEAWPCSDCEKEFTNVEELRFHHTDEHKQEPRYMCLYCSKLFIVFNGFMTHLKRHKNALKYNCDDCGKGFCNKKVLESHRLTHSDERPYVCQECGKSFRQRNALYVHTRCHLPDSEKDKYPCNQCNKRFSTKPNLVTHMRIHSGVRNFTCDQCGKSFIQKGNLDAHLLTHSHDKPFSCELCNKRFKTGMQLRKHHSVHTGAKPHQCDVCGRTFREKGTLREHHRIHTGAMPFSCEFCGKSFRFKGILTTHRRQHTGERPYSCNECQHHFTNWPNYNKHMKRRHGINTSRSTRVSNGGTNTDIKSNDVIRQEAIIEDQTGGAPQLYHELQGGPTDIFSSADLQQANQQPTYMAYNVYNISQMTAIEPTMDLIPKSLAHS
ncbi:hypothetical protein O3M35_001216 [Rhynocoris fuscipes]|uniref:Uncharacterized protein n=1 Tax=Rhynocoris fuscipes TaxID=488301 RepID=A0AAW1DSA7_9HEMI